MGLLDRLLGRNLTPAPAHDLRRVHANSGGAWYTNDPGIPGWFLDGNQSSSGIAISDRAALKVAVANRCCNIICGVMSALPLDLMRRVDERTRKPAVGNPFRDVLTVKPNRWQTPGEFKRLNQLRLLLKGNAHCYIRRLGREVRELIPLANITAKQNDDLSLGYVYQDRNGRQVNLTQSDVLHLRGLSLDGINGLSVIDYARESLGLSLQSEKVGAKLFKNGAFRSSVYQSPNALSDQAYDRLKKDLDAKKGADAEEAAGTTILEEGLTWEQPKFSAEQLQFLEMRAFERTDVGMFFGVPPFLYGDTEKSTSWGTGIEQQNIGFLQYTIANWIKIWEEALARDCLGTDDPSLYVHFDANGFFRLDSQSRREYFKAALGAGGSPAWMTPNEVREKEDMPPRDEPWADELPKAQPKTTGTANEPPQTAAN